MPHHILAAILIQLDHPHPGKQENLCLEYAAATHLQAIAVCHQAHEALAMVMAGTVAAVIAVVDPGGELGADIRRFGGTLHIVRDLPRQRSDLDRITERMYRSGLDTQQIATILEVPPEEVRRRRFRRNLRRPE